ncbi:MAG TPA: hypothetical protein VMA09_14325 [Candidatus Binataceae bacterium]|nr:hypothetical protein [Candidatus Binataceae bacterium]
MADSRCKRLAALAAFFILFLSVSGSSFAAYPFQIFYSGTENLVIDRLKLDPATVQVPNLSDAKSAVYQEKLPSPGPDLDALKQRVSDGMGLVVILGENTDSAALAALTDGRITQAGKVNVPPGPDHDIAYEGIAAVVMYVGPRADPINTNVGWLTAVRVHERSLLDVHDAEVMVRTNPYDPARPGTPILMRLHLGKGTIYVLNEWLRQGDQSARIKSWVAMLGGIKNAQNYDFQRWAYFNWLLYAMSRTAAGAPPTPFGDWIAAPVPDRAQTHTLATIFLTMTALFFVAFVITRRYSMRHPEMLERFYASSAPAAPHPQSLGAAAAPSAETGAEPSRGDPRWEIVGFHRPLSGFFYNYLLSLFIMVPLNFAVTFYIERSFINPFLEARGAWGGVQQFMLIFFTLLNVGTDQAMVKYVAEYRLTNPPRAIMFAQFFIWFHALAGVFQITVLGLVAATWMPHTIVAYLSWMVVLHTLIQFPGFIAIFFNLFRSLQRFDYAQLLIVLTYVLNPIIQMTCGIYMRHWGLMHPVFGEGMGVVFGFAIGGVIANLLMGLFCAIFYQKMGFNLITIFLAHFDRKTMKQSFLYGSKLMGGQAAIAASWGIVPILILVLLPDGLELNEIFLLTFAFTFGYLETGCYIFTTLMPSISEAYSQGMIRLTRRYLDQGLRWALMVTMMLGAAFIAFDDVFIKGLLPAQFVRAAAVMWLMHLARVVDFGTRLPDQVFQGVGRTGTFTWTSLVEHGSRVVLAAVFLKRFGFEGVYYAFIVSSTLRIILAWPLMGWLVQWPSVSLWQTIVNPLTSGFASYAILRTFAVATWQGAGHVANSALVVLICLGASLPLYMFISGLLGWDRASLAEFRDAAELVPAPFGGIATWAHRVTSYASSLSPLNNRFPGRLITEAAEEAGTLTALKAEMH